MRRAIKVARLIGLDLPLKDLNSDHLSDAAFALRDWEVSTETKRKTFNAFRGALTNFRRYSKEALPELVWPHFKRSDSKPRSLSLQEVRAMMLRFEEPYRFLFRFLLDTGLQPKEWSDLMLSDVSVPTDDDGVPSGYFLRVRQKEKGEGAPTRVVPLTSDAVTGLLGYLDYLKAQPNRAKTTHLFDIDPDHYRAEWNRVKKAAGLTDPRITPYTTRHTFGVRLAKVGVNPLVIAKLMGHTSLDTVQHYVSLSNEDINEAIKTLEKTYG
jgi:integrase